jgi:hypothetical protein
LGFLAKGIGGHHHYDHRPGVSGLWLDSYYYRKDTMGSWETIGGGKSVKVASLQSLFGEKEHIPLSWEEEEEKTKQVKNQKEN